MSEHPVAPHRGRPSRVRAVRHGAAAAVAVLAAVAVSACGGGGESSDASSSAASNLAAELVTTTPSADGEVPLLNWALTDGEPTSLDPAKVGDYSPNTVVANLCEGLMRMGADFSFEPGLATRVTRPDAKTLVFELRRGVRFTNGAPLTAADVVYSLERHRDPRLGSFWSGSHASVASVSATGAHHVTVRFKRPDALFEQMMATVAGYVSQRAYVESRGADYGTSRGGVMCTGPFALDSWASGQSIELTRNDDYWDAELTPKVAKVSFKFLTDPSTVTSALLSGDVDGAYETPATSSEVLARSTSGRLFTGPSTQISELLPAQRSGPMADPRIRRALDLAIDKEALVRNVWNGAAQPLNTFIPPFSWGTGPAREIYQAGYDALPRTETPQIEQAKALVAEAAPSRRSFVAAVRAGDQPAIQVLTFIQAAAKEIGLTMSIKQMQPTEFSDAFYNADRRSGLDLLYALGYLEIPDPLLYAPYYTQPEGLFNWTGYDDPQVARLISGALAEIDPAKSARLFVRAQAKYTPETLVIPIATPYERLYMNDRISGAPASFAYMSMPWAAMIGGAA